MKITLTDRHTVELAALTVDGPATPTMQVEILPEAGKPGRYKLYLHEADMTIIRICDLHPSQINIQELP